MIALGKNYADANLNLRFARSIGVQDEYIAASENIKDDKYNFFVAPNVVLKTIFASKMSDNAFKSYFNANFLIQT